VLDFTRFEALTFDCYGTLIDWETGIWEALAPVLRRHRVALERERALEMHASLEAEAERGPYRDYKTVLREVLQGIGRLARFEPTAAECGAFARSVGEWPAFADTREALRVLHRRFRLAIVSNIDDDLFADTAPRLGETFDWVITAERARSYKPEHANFRMALERIGLPRERVLHVAQSLYHDIAPANALGITSVWVNRRRGRAGTGATPAGVGAPDLEVPDLRTLAAAAVPGDQARRPAGR
jgi:2-haloacid dehalogenase